MNFLGKYSPNGDITLPIQAEDTGIYFFIEIGQNDAEVRKINIPVTKGDFITVPNQFQENDFISFKIKKRNRRLIYQENESKFSLLIDREDNVPSAVNNDNNVGIPLVSNSLWIHQEVPEGTIDNTNKVFIIAHQPINNTEYVYIDFFLMVRGVDYNVEPSQRRIAFVEPPEVGERIRVSYQRID